jgi:hypothetical protein
MKPRDAYGYINYPFSLWAGIAIKTGELMWASAQVISHRTQRMAFADFIPNSRDRREFTLMGREKIDALAESSQAVTKRIWELQCQANTIAWKKAFSNTRNLFLAANPTALRRRQKKWINDTFSNPPLDASRISSSIATVAQKALDPLHSRATANAKRLAKMNP